MQLFVRDNDATHTVSLGEQPTVAQLKSQLAQLASIPSVDQMLSVNGRPIDDNSSLDGMDKATLDVCVRLLGGKVHGSLARAGKVRGQTPKVDPQEKKKQKTGRAKRRMQYNRRFVNVAVGPGGRKRGPNSNADKVT